MAKKRIDEQQLLDAALQEFSDFSFEEASVNRIIEKAGITKGSFYYRFTNKYELYLHLLKQANRKKWEFINSETKTTDSPPEDIFDIFRNQAESGVRFALAHRKYYKLGKMFSKEKGTPVYEQVLKDFNVSDESGLKQLISNACDNGFFKPEFSRSFIERTISSLFISFDEIFFREEEFELEKAMHFLGELVTFLKYGLKKN